MAQASPILRRDPPAPPAPGGEGARGALISVVIVTLGLILIAVFSNYTYHLTFADNSRRSEAMAIILREAAEGHLAFEELLSGDAEAKYEAIWPHWKLAKDAATAILNGGEIATGQVPALSDSSSRATTRATLDAMHTFGALLPQRYALFVADQPADKIDRQMDNLYTAIINNTLELNRKLRGDSHKNMNLAKNVHFALVLFYLLLATGLFTVFTRHEKNRAVATQLLLKRESQLRQAQKMESIGNLAGGIAHDFNNLLQTIIGYGELLATDLEDEQRSTEEIDYILHAGRRASDLTRQLLAYSRRQMISPTSLDLNELIAGLVKMLQRLIGENINLTTALSDETLVIQADRTQMEQILMNLCLNARDAVTGAGSVTIGVERIDIGDNYRLEHVWATPGPYALLTVSDDGEGMTQEIIDHVFEPFFTTKEVGQGTGLGLSTVYGIVKQNNGMISIYSEPGQGTTIRIYWPLESAAATPLVQISVDEMPGGHESILVAEDDTDVRDFVVRVLRDAGYEVLVAQDGREAIEIFQISGGGIDLALIDVVMPRAGGREVLEHIRNSGSRIPVVFCSGYSTNSVHTDFVIHDGIVLLEKPYQQQELLKRLRQALEGPDAPR